MRLLSTNRFLLGDWIALDYKLWLVILALALAMVVGSMFTAFAYQQGAPSVIASFDYSYLAFSVMWGMVFFAERPDAMSGLGMLLIAAAGVLAMRS